MTHEQRAREWLGKHTHDITDAFQPGSQCIYSIVPEKALPSLSALLAEVEREARADARELCAKVAEDYLSDRKYDIGDDIAAAIRARGKA